MNMFAVKTNVNDEQYKKVNRNEAITGPSSTSKNNFSSAL
jgi:hypothetical protein